MKIRLIAVREVSPPFSELRAVQGFLNKKLVYLFTKNAYSYGIVL